MNQAEQSSSRPPLRRWRALLVLGLLAGLLGMHALAPGGAMGHSEHDRVAHLAVEITAPDDCADDGNCDGHHLRHADATCASGAVSGGPTLPALVPDPVTAPSRADSACSRPATAPDGARAPPSLAELQLLRI